MRGCAWIVASLALAAPALAQQSAETPEQRDARMAWWRDARFGMFIHWGVYSAAAGEWDGKRPGGAAEWLMETAHAPASEYAGLAARFNPARYDPAAWAALAREAGCKYIVITSKHHDGFCLWDSAHTDWDIASTPWKNDLLAPLKAACDKEGVRFGLYHSIMDWTHRDYAPRRAWNDLAPADHTPDFPVFVTYLHNQVAEIIRNYDPAVLWFDGEWENTWTEEHGAALEAHVRKLAPRALVNNRVGKSRSGMAGMSKPGSRAAGDFGTPEQEVPGRGLPGVDWETCMTMNDTWGFSSFDTNWKSSQTLIRTLIDVASKGGNFLLNVGPTAAGEIPEASIERLRDIGAWLKVNGEAIYGTQASPMGKLPWGRCTMRPSADGKSTTLYFHVFDWPADSVLELSTLTSKITSARVLGSAAEVKFDHSADTSRLWVVGPHDHQHATVIRAEIAGKPEVRALALKPDARGVLTLHARDAEIIGHSAAYEDRPDRDCIGFWTDKSDHVEWTFQAPDASPVYTVDITYACEPASAGSGYTIQVADKIVGSGTIESTGGWDKFVTRRIGRAAFLKPGNNKLFVSAESMPHNAVMNLRSVTLTPVSSSSAPKDAPR